MCAIGFWKDDTLEIPHHRESVSKGSNKVDEPQIFAGIPLLSIWRYSIQQ
jgi:hypothetical protein